VSVCARREERSLKETEFTGNAEFVRALGLPHSATTRILNAWSSVPFLLMLEKDWEGEPLVILGLSDYMMWPLLPPGSLLRLNKKMRTIDDRRWPEFERPIYLIEYRDKFYCCHAQRKGQNLVLISHAESPCRPSISVPSSEARVRGQLTPVFRPLAVSSSPTGHRTTNF
jgi:hypothetical protein